MKGDKKLEISKEDLPSDPVELHNELKKIDPVRANQIHPNDVRKIKRSWFLLPYKFYENYII